MNKSNSYKVGVIILVVVFIIVLIVLTVNIVRIRFSPTGCEDFGSFGSKLFGDIDCEEDFDFDEIGVDSEGVRSGIERDEEIIVIEESLIPSVNINEFIQIIEDSRVIPDGCESNPICEVVAECAPIVVMKDLFLKEPIVGKARRSVCEFRDCSHVFVKYETCSRAALSPDYELSFSPGTYSDFISRTEGKVEVVSIIRDDKVQVAEIVRIKGELYIIFGQSFI